MFGRGSQFDRALEKATSQLLLEPDWDSILQIVDHIRQEDIQPKYALTAIKRKIAVDNPHVCMFALQTLESCVKNCGAPLHEEIATKEFMEFLKDLAKIRPDPVKGKFLELVQVWSHAFRNEPNYKVVQDTYQLMKMEGYPFPTLKEADSMFLAEKAPEWKDGECCSHCRVAFGMMQRKHHCRNCGDVFCNKCSSKNSIIPKFGIERDVRVCDVCYGKLNKTTKKEGEDDLPVEYLASPLSKQQQTPPQKTEQEIQEEEELQLALALSQSEQETKEKERDRLRANYGIYGGPQTSNSTSTPPPNRTSQTSNFQPISAPMIDTTDMDPELAHYLNRNYWQQRSSNVDTKLPVSTTTPSAPVVTTEAKVSVGKMQEVNDHVRGPMENGETVEDQNQFLNALSKSVEIFVNRMRSNSQRGRSIANDSSVQSLFNVISNMHPQLMKYLQEQEEFRSNYEALQDKLAQLRDAREALDALREDHREKKRREYEELERQRQIQMAQKLEIMRQKKHEYLEMQRRMALQRLQEQEMEMQMRMEQQKHLTQMRQYQNYGYPQQQYPQGPMPGMQQYPPPQAYAQGGGMEGSPVHMMQGHQPGQMAQPGGVYIPQQSMGPGPAMGSTPGGLPPQISTQQMYAPAPAQPAFSQAGGPYQSLPVVTQNSNLPAGYQIDGSLPAPGGGNYQPNSSIAYMPASTQGGNVPGQTGQPPLTNQPYAGVPPGTTLDYQSYNLQGMANALPQQQSQQQFVGGAPPPQGQYPQGPPPQQMTGPPPTQQTGAPPPPPQNQQAPPGPHEAELISFD